jgi:dTDP-4-amino-4,6-dideoxygalactose transaminase
MVSFTNPDITDREIEAATRALSEGTLSTGEIVSEFESEFAEFVGCKAAAAVCSGGTALEVAFEVSDLTAGEKVIVSPVNCAAVMYAILNVDLIPVFADVNPETANISSDGIRAAIRREDGSLDGILLTHLHGQSCDLDEIDDIIEENDLIAIEDFAQAPGTEYRGTEIGTFGDIGVCSFGATKNLTVGEGGMIVSDNRTAIKKARQLRSSSNGDAPQPLRSVRMSDIEAAIGREQLARYGEIVRQRRKVADWYDSSLPTGIEPAISVENSTHVYSNYLAFTERPDDVASHLVEEGIEATTYDALLTEYTCAEPHAVELQEARFVYDNAIFLPIHSKLTREDVTDVTDTIRSYKRDHSLRNPFETKA